MNRLDEATTAALTGVLQELYSVTWALCYLIYACERLRDYDRAAQWCQKMKEFVEPYQFRFALGICRAHYGGVLVWRGTWDQAEAELSTATQDFEVSRPPMAAEAVVRLAELRRRQGRVREAAELFGQVEWHPLAVLGLAELALDEGDTTTTAERAQGLLRNVPADNKTQRVAALDILVRSAAASGEHLRASEMLDVLKALSTAIDSPSLRASTTYSEGVVATTSGDYPTARQCFEEAAVVFGRVGAPYEMARARIELARVLSRLGRLDAAEREATSALESFQRIGTAAESERASAFIRELTAARARPGDFAPQSKLTARELEVLRLVAQGLGDREIASALTLSEHTVHRHVANILSCLDCLHDMARPDLLAATIRRAIKPDGVWFIVDIESSADFEENLANPLSPLMYGYSILTCLASSASTPDGLALGTVGLPEPRMRELVTAVGFSRFQSVAGLEHPFNAYYEARR